MKIKGISNRFLLLMIIGIFVCIRLDFRLAEGSLAEQQEQSNASSISNLSWQLEDGWTINGSELVATGHGWAYYKESCSESAQTLKFKLNRLEGGLHSNLNVNGSDRYAIGTFNNGSGLLSTYLFKQSGAIPPPSEKYFQGQSVICNLTDECQVDIISQDGHIQVFIYKAGQRSAATLPVVDYLDPDPLPSGKIAFESLNDSVVRLYDFEAVCPLPSSEEDEPLDLGPIHFKRPA